ncbi:hypothetical protein [Absidia glauca]|uniref:Alkyl hydroperoxide reductase subunit C/ Thiol specific antioxidant domain-containing protein n=1 Tax=Absidia glauca TaxID=4829 RepID=A0A163JBU3_ABSGL|nr:hypothetical protein [Absidia glauca]
MIITNRATDEDFAPMIRKRFCRTNTVPDFRCDASHLGQTTPLCLSEVFQHYKSVVLFFYDTDLTPHHHRDIEQVREHYQDFMDKSALPMMVSINGLVPHQDNPPNFPLLGDSDRSLARHFHEGEACRSVFVIDNHHKVKYSFMPLDLEHPYSVPVILSIAGGIMNQGQ